MQQGGFAGSADLDAIGAAAIYYLRNRLSTAIYYLLSTAIYYLRPSIIFETKNAVISAGGGRGISRPGCDRRSGGATTCHAPQRQIPSGTTFFERE